MKNKHSNLKALKFDTVKKINGDFEGLLNYFIDEHPSGSKKDFLYFLNQYLLSQGKLKSSYAYSALIDFNGTQNKNITNSLKEILKKTHRAYTRLRLNRIVGDKQICIVGPGKQCRNKISDSNLLILLKLYHPEHLTSFDDKKLVLIWNGSACDRYLCNPITLPDNVTCILAKTTMSGVRAIRLNNPGITVFQYKTLNQAKWGHQTIIVDAIQLFHGITKMKVRLTGFDLRVSEYQENYKKIYEAHTQNNSLLKQFYNGHAPYTEYFLMRDYYKKGFFIPDERLKEILNLNIDEYLMRLEQLVN